MQMELLSNARIPDGLLASMTLLSEKPRLGVRSRESALHPGIDERNSTAVLGLRFGWSGIVSGTVVAPSNCNQLPGTSSTIVSGSATSNIPTIEAGAAIGGAIGGPVGAFVGGIFGSFFGVGVTASYVPSTHSWYGGPTVVFGLGVGGGSGVGANAVNVPYSQNPNSIASGLSYSLTYQPSAALGSTVQYSPGSGPPVVGPSAGTRIPVSAGVSYNIPINKGHC